MWNVAEEPARLTFPHQTFILTWRGFFPSSPPSPSLLFPLVECVIPGTCHPCRCDADPGGPSKPFLKVNVPGPGSTLEVRQAENCSPISSNLPLIFVSPSFSLTRAHTRCALYPPECLPRCEQAPEHVCSLFHDTPPFNQTSYNTLTGTATGTASHTHTHTAHTHTHTWCLSSAART